MPIRILKSNPGFWCIACIFFFTTGIYVTLVPAKDSFIQLNSIHTLYLDTFFQNYTILGDGVFSIALFLVLLLMERAALAMQVIIAYLFSGILSQVIKHMVHAPRPLALLGHDGYPYFIEGVTYGGMNSFPSGHTSSVFALAILLSLHNNNKGRGIAYLVLAIITGYSRIYLGQHFLLDVLAGALLGTVCALFVYVWLKEVRIEWSHTSEQVRIQMQ